MSEQETLERVEFINTLFEKTEGIELDWTEIYEYIKGNSDTLKISKNDTPTLEISEKEKDLPTVKEDDILNEEIEVVEAEVKKEEKEEPSKFKVMTSSIGAGVGTFLGEVAGSIFTGSSVRMKEAGAKAVIAGTSKWKNIEEGKEKAKGFFSEMASAFTETVTKVKEKIDGIKTFFSSVFSFI